MSATTLPPIQPLHTDDEGVLRFRLNRIVQVLLDSTEMDLNDLAVMDFEPWEQEQFTMLIGYSLAGFGDLDYVRDETYERAEAAARRGEEP